MRADEAGASALDIITRAARIDFSTLLRALMKQLLPVTRSEKRQIESIAHDILRWTLRESDSMLSGLLGRPVPPGWGMSGEFVNDRLASFAKENEEALRAIGTDLLEDVRETMLTSEGLDIDAAAKLLTERYDVTKSKAAFYAEDQAKKLQGAIDKGRFEALGLDSYIWRTVGDNDVRPEHRAREGKTFQFANPPPDGNPSEPYGCRCYAEPVIEGVELPDLDDPNFLGPEVARLAA